MVEENVLMALECNYSKGSVEKTVEMMLLFNDAINGNIVPITHSNALGVSYNQLMGADNRNGVTCYLDTLLFSMFARLESFEPMLRFFDYEKDPKKASLSIFLRLYINMMRSGLLITTDITKILLSSIKKSGWNESCFDKQQDAGDLFDFIADQLDMPMITLKLEIAHEGKEDNTDDHKLIKERMLLVSVPGGEEDKPILLEQCLESYFANSIQVSRQIARRKTIGSLDDPRGRTRKFSVSIQTTEVTGSSTSINIIETPSQVFYEEETETSVSSAPPPAYDPLFKPTYNITEKGKPIATNPLWTNNMEINLPAWMFLQLVPFYTNSTSSSKTGLPIPTATDQFATTRPVLGISLKRSEWSADSQSVLNTREVIVPPVIRFPSFVADDQEADEGTPSNYVLVLESAIFHRGKSTASGHFVALLKENSHIGYSGAKKSHPSDDSSQGSTRWLLFDDLKPAGEKIMPADYSQVFHEEKPYILFYRLVTLEDFELESERHTACNPSPSPSSISPDPPSSSVISFLDVREPMHGDTPFTSTSSLRSTSHRISSTIRRKTKSRPNSLYDAISRSPSPLRHSTDDSRNTLAVERHPPSQVEDVTKLKKSKTTKFKHKSFRHSKEHDDYKSEKCVIQ